MKLKIYQNFYSQEQFAGLDPNFIPHNNLANLQPTLCEGPLIINLYQTHRFYDGYWGLLSWKFFGKTSVVGSDLIKTLNELGDEYDVYHLNPFKDAVHHPFIQGEFHHPGMIKFANRLLNKLGFEKTEITKLKFEKEHVSFCSYYIGNSTFWDRWIAFLTTCLDVCHNDEELKTYLYACTSINTDKPNYPYIVERLVTLFFYLNREFVKVKRLM